MTEGFGPKVGGFDHFVFGNHKSLKKKINIERCEKILISAMKQSQNSILPQINKPINFQHFLEKSQTNLYIAHCHKTPKRNFFNSVNSSLIIIGLKLPLFLSYLVQSGCTF